MKCFGDFKNDRTCELCEICNNEEYLKCRNKVDKERRERLALAYIDTHCIHKEEGWDEYYRYISCGSGHKDNPCRPTLYCICHLTKEQQKICISILEGNDK